MEGINQLRFAKASGWVDNRAKDLFFYSDKLYYSTDKDVLMTSGKAKVVTIPVITGLQEDVQETDPTLNTKRGLTLRLSLLVEAVQPNRFEEIWHINSIPTVDAEVLPGG